MARVAGVSRSRGAVGSFGGGRSGSVRRPQMPSPYVSRTSTPYVLDDALQEPYNVQKHGRAIYFLYTS